MYVIGIDFGHGETSAAVLEVNDELYEHVKSVERIVDNSTLQQVEQESDTCDENMDSPTTEWNAEEIKKLLLKSFYTLKDLKIKGDTKSIKSILCFDWKSQKWDIGPNDAKLKHCISDLDVEQNQYPKLAAYFKGPLVDGRGSEQHSNTLSKITDENRDFFGDFVKNVFYSIIESNTIIHRNPQNFRLYVACPSEWDKCQINEYLDFLQYEGLPCEEVIEESRAAYMSFRDTILGNSIENKDNSGILVIDFGSSTIDFTYYGGKEPINHGYQHGAHIVEETLFNYMISHETTAKKGFEKLTAAAGDNEKLARTLLVYNLRNKKEKFYNDLGENNEAELDDVVLKTIMHPVNGSGVTLNSGDCFGFDDYGYNETKMEEILADYIKDITSDFSDFKHKEGVGNVNFVILTGGASKMNFVRRLTEDVYGVHKCTSEEIENGVKETLLTDDNATFSISRGIAKYGTYRTLSAPIRNAIEYRLDTTWRNFNWVKENLNELISQVVYDVYHEYFCGILDEWVKMHSNIKSDAKKNLNKVLEQIYKDILKKDPDNYIWKCIKEAEALFVPGARSIHALLRVLYDGIELSDKENRDVINKLMQEKFNFMVNELVDPLLKKYISLYFEDESNSNLETKLPEFYEIKIAFGKTEKISLLRNLIEKICSKINSTALRTFNANSLNCDRNYFNGRHLSRVSLSQTIEDVIAEFCHTITPKFNIETISTLCMNCVNNKYEEIKYRCELEPYHL